MTRPLRSTDPASIGDYELIGRIGGGGMGDVFLGRSPSGRLAAVKVVRDLLADDPRFRVRFAREVAAARSVSGAYTAAVLDADPDAERPWLATAYIDGPSLLDRVAEQGPLSVQETRALGAGLAEALRDIHRAGLVHRDLKPGNVLLAEDGPRLIDFGIIRVEDGAGLTETGYVLGSAGFMAPEQASGGEATAAADIYALGAVLTFAVTGHGPFGDGPTPGVLLRQASGDRDIAAVPEGLRDVVARCLDILPGARPTTGSLLQLLGGNAIEDAAVADAVVAKDSTKQRTKVRTKGHTKSPEPDRLLRASSAGAQNAEIADVPTTVMRSEPGKGGKNTKNTKSAKSAKSAKNTQSAKASATSKGLGKAAKRSQPQPQPIPTRRKFLYLGVAGVVVAGFGWGVADRPPGDTKTTGAESDGSGDQPGIPTTESSGNLGGPLKKPLWSHTSLYADFLALSGNTLLVQGTTLTAFDPGTGNQLWTAPDGSYGESSDGTLPVVADTAYETALSGGVAAVEVKKGVQSWTSPVPASWTTRGLIGASAEVVLGWSFIDVKQTDSNGLWGVDPSMHLVSWQTPVGAIDGSPYYSADTGLILLSQPQDNKLTAYYANSGKPAWTAKDGSQSTYAALATGITSHGGIIYWGTNRLYAFDKSGKPVWPVGISNGSGGNFHTVIADDDAVYAAATGGSLEDSNVICAYKVSDGAPLWQSAWPKSDYPDPALECQLALGGGNLYIADHDTGALIALDAKTGRTLWQFRDHAASKADAWSVVANPLYVFIGYGTTVHGFDAH
ncbi:PQQ-binding-like beta-propeller repeat protein [Catenulispora sp. NF23]|uniref:serine/threonine-protein kinase n=1 Tax=Catenulispora pinistramenti TaxID=2705254 RepID=UPI001BAE1FFD|nr:serine/threonine-protein kinase [Catenulispora pinistramenti]MBS2539168.1 PQQ-binding-like beta-propeller repeat protein [Catenulispora pinistramenti]